MEKSKAAAACAVTLAAAAFFAVAWFLAPDAVFPAVRAKAFLSRSVAPRLRGMARGWSAGAELARAEREAAALSLQLAETADLRAENAKLRRALDFAARPGARRIAAEVVSSGGGAAAPYRKVRISKGQADGIREGMVAETPEGLAGRVVAVSRRTADVMLLPDPSVAVSCRIDTGGRPLYGILSGGTDELLELKHLGAEEGAAPEPPPRSKVWTSGLGGVFPPGMLVGTWADGKVAPAVDFPSLEVLFIRK